MTTAVTPVYLVTGFLGSGKTTLLSRMLERLKQEGKKPAVVMNELGDVNLDGLLVESDVPMNELLSGCICCSIRGDLTVSLRELIERDQPDVIIIESTGAANPLEIIDAVTDVAMLTPLRLEEVVTVLDAQALLERKQTGKGKTFRLMQEQARAGTLLLLNKADLVSAEEAEELEALLREWNRKSPIVRTVRSVVDLNWLSEPLTTPGASAEQAAAPHKHDESCGCGRHAYEHAHHHDGTHHSHHHLMALTHYFDGPIIKERFEALIRSLPEDIFRAKGIIRFDNGERVLFQYAYREYEAIPVTPQKEVPDVAVFIGEHFERQPIEAALAGLRQ